jgi:hypothetical protein
MGCRQIENGVKKCVCVCVCVCVCSVVSWLSFKSFEGREKG